MAFPNDGIVAEGATGQMPYYSAATGTILQYVPYNYSPYQQFLFDGTYDDLYFGYGNLIVVNSWLNKANPDWLNLYDLTSAQMFGPSSDLTFYPSDVLINSAVVTVHDPISPGLDYWWGTTQFAKFGFFCWGAPNPVGETQWINFKQCSFISSSTQYNGCGFAGFQGTQVSVVAYSRLDVSPITLNDVQYPIPS